MTTTTDRNDPRLGYGSDSEPRAQNEAYLVLPDEEIAKGYVRPYRAAYVHTACGTETIMAERLAATYARQPTFYGATYCVGCQQHRPVGEFTWSADGTVVGS